MQFSSIDFMFLIFRCCLALQEQDSAGLRAMSASIRGRGVRISEVVTQEMDSSGSLATVQSTLEKLSSDREELGELWSTRKMRLDLCLQLRLFERDALELSSQFEVWGEQLQSERDLPRDQLGEAERAMRMLDEHLNHIQSATYNVVQRRQDLLQVSDH